MTLEPTYNATKMVGYKTNNSMGQRNEHLLSECRLCFRCYMKLMTYIISFISPNYPNLSNICHGAILYKIFWKSY